MASYGSRTEPAFESPYKPPSGLEDLIADMDRDKDYPYTAMVGGLTFRHRAPSPKGLLTFVTSQKEYNPNAQMRLQQRVRFINQHIHPEDATELMVRIIDADDPFGGEELKQLVREIGKAGTARPTQPSCRWRQRR